MKSKAHSSQNGRSRVCEVDTIRVVEIDGNPWFNAHDVVQVLGVKNTANAIRPLHENETSVYRMNTSGRPSRIISESGLYKIIMRSDKPEARAFQDWVTQVVLPAIRKDGGSPDDRRGNTGAGNPMKQGVLNLWPLMRRRNEKIYL
ncbi:Bro-N domain-containing protein [Ruegeria sp. THAF33]|uniref:BRO-N domain-containing protein n=1 Tax=Ruegeria sp. THAF33 TaxID=2587853 RepID=UPI00126927BB|nr:hypothetical protein FIU92_03960 [Ruegeria sp. THAF33]